jgi:diguanylate cyclase (GGDEF)-like protein
VSLLSAGLLLSAFAIWNDTVFDLFGYSFAAISSFVFALSWASISAMVENVHLNRLVMTDGLTGVYSHRYFEIILKKEIESASVENGELSLAILDIDDFKMVNDTHGHEAGNDTLRSVARIIKERVLPPGIVARFGGDEFVVLLPGISSEKAYNVVSGIVEAARRMAFPWLPKDRTITISSGLATVRCYRELTYGDIMKSADAELYKAKSSGKNRVSVKRYFNK